MVGTSIGVGQGETKQKRLRGGPKLNEIISEWEEEQDKWASKQVAKNPLLQALGAEYYK
jgi:hypothetical protein